MLVTCVAVGRRARFDSWHTCEAGRFGLERNRERIETMTKNGDVFALQLARRGVPVSDHVRDVCGLLARCAVTIQRLVEEECNGPAWIDYARGDVSARVERWQADLERRQRLAELRFGRHVEKLRGAVAVADSDGVNKYVGGWRVFGDPRGSTSDVFVTAGGRDEWLAVLS